MSIPIADIRSRISSLFAQEPHTEIKIQQKVILVLQKTEMFIDIISLVVTYTRIPAKVNTIAGTLSQSSVVPEIRFSSCTFFTDRLVIFLPRLLSKLSSLQLYLS
jgi:hypothetical protein